MDWQIYLGREALRMRRMLRARWLPGSIWGVNNAPPLPAVFSPGSNVTCTAGSEVTCVTTSSALVAIPGQNYVPIISGAMTFLMGGTASASLVLGARFHSGSDFANQTVDTGLLANSATIAIPVFMVGVTNRCAGNGNFGSGAIEVTALAGTTACTCRAASTFLGVFLLPGPDTQI